MTWFDTCTNEEYDTWMDSPLAKQLVSDGEDAYNKWYHDKPFEACIYERGSKEEVAWQLGWTMMRRN